MDADAWMRGWVADAVAQAVKERDAWLAEAGKLADALAERVTQQAEEITRLKQAGQHCLRNSEENERLRAALQRITRIADHEAPVAREVATMALHAGGEETR